MRRFTLLTIVFLFLVLTGAAVYQVVLVTGKQRTFPGPGISGGDDLVVVNSLIGLPREDAIDLLDDVDLAYRVEPSGEDGEDRVVAQAPAPGSVVPRGTEVTLTVDCVPAPCPEGRELDDPCSCETA